MKYYTFYRKKGVFMENNKQEVLYKKVPGRSTIYTCLATGNKCAIATHYFTAFRKMLEEYSRTGAQTLFCTRERNLCVEEKCPIYNETMAKIAEYAKEQSLQK